MEFMIKYLAAVSALVMLSSVAVADEHVSRHSL